MRALRSFDVRELYPHIDEHPHAARQHRRERFQDSLIEINKLRHVVIPIANRLWRLADFFSFRFSLGDIAPANRCSVIAIHSARHVPFSSVFLVLFSVPAIRSKYCRKD